MGKTKITISPAGSTGTLTLSPARPTAGTQEFWISSSSAEIEQGVVDTDLEGAVFTYVQAIRALGRTRLNTVEIANALSLKVAEVDAVVVKLRERGIRTVA